MEQVSGVDAFRVKLSEKLKQAMAARQKEDVSTIRSLMAALDNASAISQDEISKLKDSSVTEVPRRILTQQEIEGILQTEIEIRKKALSAFERIGNQSQAELVRHSIATILQLSKILK